MSLWCPTCGRTVCICPPPDEECARCGTVGPVSEPCQGCQELGPRCTAAGVLNVAPARAERDLERASAPGRAALDLRANGGTFASAAAKYGVTRQAVPS